MTSPLELALERLYSFRAAVLIPAHALLIVMANQAAFWLRFDGSVPEVQRPYDVTMLPLLLLVRLGMFIPMRLHEGVWRYASIWDLRNILAAVGASSLVFFAIVHYVFGITQYPRSVFIIDAILLVCLMGGFRLGRRLYMASSRAANAKRVIIYGAGDAGEMIARDMLVHPERGSVPVCFLDDDPSKDGDRIHGVRVRGTKNVADVIDLFRPDEILIAIPSAEPKTMRRILSTIRVRHVPIKTLPRVREIGHIAVTLNEVRELSVADLLSRVPLGLDPARVRSLVEGQTVLVTGAGGSIGSELCRQTLLAGPARLVMLDRNENGLFAIHKELSALKSGSTLVAAIGDITDQTRLEQVFAAERPTVVFHAAAHKHVPLMEDNPSEAVKNNIRGTRLLADASLRWSVKRFVLISTDKAVNPTSVMGATKRVAEAIIRRKASAGTTSFTAVRFGNVLGSNGSVVPTFLEQIKAGGPVTVTHPEMRRFFMLIPEAVQLVLHAAALGGRGSMYVLDMGEQIKVAEMARNLIRLAGFVPDEDIELVFTGIRPGEKLFEELVGPGETAKPSEVEKVQIVETTIDAEPEGFEHDLLALEAAALKGDDQAVMKALKVLIQSPSDAAGATLQSN
jgi:FlaA1/EpsC-like NDP-sugar epimerase